MGKDLVDKYGHSSTSDFFTGAQLYEEFDGEFDSVEEKEKARRFYLEKLGKLTEKFGPNIFNVMKPKTIEIMKKYLTSQDLKELGYTEA